jgi:hypothetical protein
MEKSNEVPENILKKANLLREKLLPVKSKAAYEKVYSSFCYWRQNNKVSAVTRGNTRLFRREGKSGIIHFELHSL